MKCEVQYCHVQTESFQMSSSLFLKYNLKNWILTQNDPLLSIVNGFKFYSYNRKVFPHRDVLIFGNDILKSSVIHYGRFKLQDRLNTFTGSSKWVFLIGTTSSKVDVTG